MAEKTLKVNTSQIKINLKYRETPKKLIVKNRKQKSAINTAQKSIIERPQFNILKINCPS